jgi:hypothetical protein
MNNMKEILPKYVKQIPGEPRRRWFEDNYFDLIVWENELGQIAEFQLCYDKLHNQRSLIWKEQIGYMHNKVDDGENKPGRYKATPILIDDGVFDFVTIAEKFKYKSKDIDTKVSTFVFNKIKKYHSSGYCRTNR